MGNFNAGHTWLDDVDNLFMAAGLGLIPGWEVIRLFGMNAAVVTGNQEMWPPGTARVLPTAAGVVSVVSDDAADDGSPAGLGAWTVQVRGLDENYERITEIVTLNGISAVTTTAEFLRVTELYVITAGTDETNAGNISASIGGDLQQYIELGEGRNHSTHWTVPANKTLVVTQFKLGVGRMSGSTDLHILSQIKPFIPDSAWQTVDDAYLFNGGITDERDYPFIIPEKYEIRQQIITDTSTQAFSVWSGYLIQDDAWRSK